MNAETLYNELGDIKEQFPDAFTDEEWEAVELNKEQVMVLKMISQTKETYYQKIETAQFHKQEKRKAWKKAHAEVSNEGHSALQLLQHLTQLGYGDIKEFCSKKDGDKKMELQYPNGCENWSILIKHLTRKLKSNRRFYFYCNVAGIRDRISSQNIDKFEYFSFTKVGNPL